MPFEHASRYDEVVQPLPPLPPNASPPGTLFNRRTLLKVGGVGGLALIGGAWLFRTLRGFGPPAKGHFVFDHVELNVVEKMAEAFFPGAPEWPYSAAEVELPRFVDLYVSGLYDDTQSLFRTLVRTLNVSTVVGYGTTFRELSLKDRQDALHSWSVSDLKLRRAGYLALSSVCNIGYFEDDRVRAAGELTTGCDLSAGPKRPDLWTMRGVR